MALYTVAGLSHKIELPVPLYIKLIDPKQTNQRPGIKRIMPGYWVQHETGNTRVGADAEMHYRYMLSGAPDSQGRSQQLGYHFATDDSAIYQMVPIDEVTWQAADSDGPGNMSGISNEMCVNVDGNMALARRNSEALAGGVLKALGMGGDRVKRHYDFNAADPDRHFCPYHMMIDGYWPTFVANVGKIIGGAIDVPKQATTYPAGMDEGITSWLFGRIEKGGKVYSFDPNGPVSRAWLKYGARYGYTALVDMWRFSDGREYFKFSSFTLWRANAKGAFAPLESGEAA